MEMYCVCTTHQLCPGCSSVKQLHQIQRLLHVNYVCIYSSFICWLVYVYTCLASSAIRKVHIMRAKHHRWILYEHDSSGQGTNIDFKPTEDVMCLQSTFKAPISQCPEELTQKIASHSKAMRAGGLAWRRHVALCIVCFHKTCSLSSF